MTWCAPIFSQFFHQFSLFFLVGFTKRKLSRKLECCSSVITVPRRLCVCRTSFRPELRRRRFFAKNPSSSRTRTFPAMSEKIGKPLCFLVATASPLPLVRIRVHPRAMSSHILLVGPSFRSTPLDSVTHPSPPPSSFSFSPLSFSGRHTLPARFGLVW